MAVSPYEQFRAVRASTRVPRQAVAQLVDVARGVRSMLGVVRPTPPSTLNGPIGPHRRYAWASVSVADIKQVRKHDTVGALALEYTVLTAARTGEVLGATWDEFDLKSAVWTIPAKR